MSDQVAITPKVQLYLPTPDNISGVTSWFRAADLSASLTEGAAVTTWADHFPTGRALVPGAGTLRYRAAAINGKPGVEFDGASYLQDNGFTFGSLLGANGVGVMIVVLRTASLTTIGIITQGTGSGAGIGMYNSGSFGIYPFAQNDDGGGIDYAYNHTVTPGSFEYLPSAFLWMHDPAVTGLLYVGAQPNGGASNSFDDADLLSTPSGNTSNLSAGFRVGDAVSGGVKLTGIITDVITCNRLLTQRERRQLGAWICTESGIPFAGTRDNTLDAALWVDVSGDVVSNVKATWGIHGNGPSDRIADPGGMTFDLDDSARNSGLVRGYYSPDNVLARPGFDVGTPARLTLTNDLLGTKVKWQGTIDDVNPVPGVTNPRAAVTCMDWMDEAARTKITGIGVQTNVQADALVGTIVATVQRQPPNGLRIGTGSDIYPYALDTAKDESSKVRDELQKIVLSEYGMIYVDAGVFVFEGRKLRGGAGSVRFTLDDNDNLVGLPSTSYARDDLLNRVQVSVHPRTVDAAPTTVLFSLGSYMPLATQITTVVNCQYHDPAQQAQRVGGVSMVAPVASTDYLFNTASDGSGTDITSQLAVSAAFGGNAAVVSVTNNGPLDGFIVKLQLRGKGLYDFNPVMLDLADAQSVAKFGESPFSYDMPYQAAAATGSDLAQFILALNKAPTTRTGAVMFIGNWSSVEADACFNLQISDRVALNVPSLGLLGRQFFVNGFQLDVSTAGLVAVTLDLAPASQAQFWLLDIPGRTELNVTTVLGFGLFLPGWILDVSTLGTDTFLN